MLEKKSAIAAAIARNLRRTRVRILQVDCLYPAEGRLGGPGRWRKIGGR